MNKTLEYITCSAIYYSEGDTTHLPANLTRGLVVAGHRHHNCFEILSLIYPNREYKNKVIQGFLTSKNRFVDRTEGAEIASKAGQTKEKLEVLYSEDIY